MKKPNCAEPILLVSLARIRHGGRMADEEAGSTEHGDAERIQPMIEADRELPDVNAPGVELLGTPDAIEFRQAAEDQQMGHHTGHHVRDGRAPGNIHNRLADQLVNGSRARRVRLRGLNAAVRSATAPGNYGCSVSGSLLQNVLRGASSDGAIHSAVIHWHRTLDQQNVFASSVFDCVLQALFGLMACGGLQSFRVVERKAIEQHIGNNRVGGADKGFASAGAFLGVQPNNRRARFRFEGLHNGGYCGRFDAGHHRGETTEAHKFAPRISLYLHRFPNRGSGLAHKSSPQRQNRIVLRVFLACWPCSYLRNKQLGKSSRGLDAIQNLCLTA
jgi:hypothetical protein